MQERSQLPFLDQVNPQVEHEQTRVVAQGFGQSASSTLTNRVVKERKAAQSEAV